MAANVLDTPIDKTLRDALVEMSRTIAESRRETERVMAESRRESDRALAESRRETNRAMAELRAELRAIQEMGEKRSKAADERIKKLGEKVDKLGDFYGGVSENIGHHAEEFFQNALWKTKTFAGIKFDDLKPNLQVSESESCEFDMALVNCETAAIIEARNRVRLEYLEVLRTKKVAQFRKFYPEYAHCQIYLGVAGFSFDARVFAEAEKYGIGIIRQDGDTVQVDAGGLKVY